MPAEVKDRSPPNLYEMYTSIATCTHRHFNRSTRLEMPAQRIKIVDRFSPNNHTKVDIIRNVISGYCSEVHQSKARLHHSDCTNISYQLNMQLSWVEFSSVAALWTDF